LPTQAERLLLALEPDEACLVGRIPYSRPERTKEPPGTLLLRLDGSIEGARSLELPHQQEEIEQKSEQNCPKRPGFTRSGACMTTRQKEPPGSDRAMVATVLSDFRLVDGIDVGGSGVVTKAGDTTFGTALQPACGLFSTGGRS